MSILAQIKVIITTEHDEKFGSKSITSATNTHYSQKRLKKKLKSN